ncbi:HAD family hydrolase [Elizabethkingia anophelis]|uniref:ABC transporter ATP-binding protein n=1 Tax=Elizabethkingia anophelis TaxID=1117645 RepID=A0A494J506_9FLAO|nr:HAD family phosphatase [Elizabethkingia anophelis]AQX49294.1 ABC transporter ATP-binding protein [Elizabethkingia anophelis]AVF48075.1 HAD family phosphatase [Elizabethkingia anophelis]AVF52069.1 HAD family phosphatase [Elizabethkingia anophelis]ELB0069060.1 HAD family phosphatase [Elizabethkingia anophelis]ELB1894146.1 HAD family phosphatase [Elizabethkingia anophelis]
MPLKAVLFDMDGVIVDTEPLHRKAYFKMFDEFGINVSEELFTSFTGKTTQSVCQELISRFNLNYTPQELTDKKRINFKYLFDTDPDFDLIPGVRNLIENYHQHDVKMILASSASMNTINWVFERFDLEKYFAGKISGADLKQSKPHPEIFELAAGISGEEKNNCIVIEDSTNGIQAAYAADIFCVAYKSEHSKNQKYDKAQKVISDYSEILYETSTEWFK